MKKILCVWLALLLLTVLPMGQTLAQTALEGDVNGDGRCDTVDVRLVLRKLVGPDSGFSAEETAAVDLDGDGKVTSMDVRYMLSMMFKSTCTVTFTDHDGTVLATESVKTGATAPLPTAPSKSQATFIGWSGTYANVTKNETVTAVYSDSPNVFTVSAADGCVGDTVTVLVSVDGAVKTCGFRADVFYDPSLELVSYDDDLDLDVIVNSTKYEHGISLNFSAASDKSKQRDIMELTFRILETDKPSLPIRLDIIEVMEVTDSGRIQNTQYTVVDGMVNVR